MSRWTDQYANHPFPGLWAGLTSAAASAVLPENADIALVEELARLRKLLGHLDAAVQSLDPELVNLDQLANLANATQATLNELQAYAGNPLISHLRNANAQGDSLAVHLQRCPMTTVPTDASAISASAETFRTYVNEWHAAANKNLATMGEIVTKLETRTDDADRSVEKLEGRMQGLESQFQTQSAGFNQTFTQSETSRAERFDKWQDAQQTKADDAFAEAAKKHATGIGVLDKYQDEAARVLGSVVNTSQAGAYATYANEEKASANRFRSLAMTLMVLAGLVLFLPELWHLAQVAGGYSVDWQKALYRLPFSLVLFAPATYLARESSKHRSNEVLNRRRQHILTTIEPYLALLPKEKAEDIKAEVAKSLFADTIALPADKDDDQANTVAQVSNLVTQLLKQKR